MPTFRTGDMWSEFDLVDHFIITTNSVIKNNNALVMGAGIAKQVRDKWPGIDVQMGLAIRSTCVSGGTYGLILGNCLGMFQVKHHFKAEADLGLIANSAAMLRTEALANPKKLYALNYPGIGNGKRAVTDVAPLLADLPSNVHIWSFK